MNTNLLPTPPCRVLRHSVIQNLRIIVNRITSSFQSGADSRNCRMSVKRFLLSSLLATLIFIGGVLVGKHILSAPIEIVVIDVDKLVWLMEKYNTLADEIKKEMAKMKEWNEQALIEEPEKEDKK